MLRLDILLLWSLYWLSSLKHQVRIPEDDKRGPQCSGPSSPPRPTKIFMETPCSILANIVTPLPILWLLWSHHIFISIVQFLSLSHTHPPTHIQTTVSLLLLGSRLCANQQCPDLKSPSVSQERKMKGINIMVWQVPLQRRVGKQWGWEGRSTGSSGKAS